MEQDASCGRLSLLRLRLASCSASDSAARRPGYRSLRRPVRRLSVIAGSSRITVCCVQLINRPRSKHWPHDRRAVDRQLQADHQPAHAQLRDNRQLVDQRRQPLAESLAQSAWPAPAVLRLRSFRSWRCRPGRRSDCRRTWPRACRAAGWGRSRPSSAAPRPPCRRTGSWPASSRRA